MKKTIIASFMMAMLAGIGIADTVNLTTDNFQADTVDALLPKTAVAGVHGAYAYGTGVGQIYVKADPLDATNNVAMVYKDAATGGSYLYASPQTGTVKTFDQLSADSQSILLSYDVYVNSTNKNHFYVSLQYGSNAALGTIYFKLPSGGNTAIDYLVAGGTQTATGVNASTNAWYTVTYDFHQLENGNWAFSANMVNKATSASTTLVTDAVATLSGTDVNSVSRINFYQFGSTAAESYSYIDNISLSYIPEPFTAGLLLIGGTAIFAHRRK